MPGEKDGLRVVVPAATLGAPRLSKGARVSASGIVTGVDPAGSMTLEDVRVAVDGADASPAGRTLIVAAEDTLRSSFRRNAAKFAWMIPAGICASLLLALYVAADYNDLYDVEPRYWELLLKGIAVAAGLWFLYAVARARGLKTANRIAQEFTDEIVREDRAAP
jgi:hypothetical protein